jgi:hypothetical protein
MDEENILDFFTADLLNNENIVHRTNFDKLCLIDDNGVALIILHRRKLGVIYHMIILILRFFMLRTMALRD